MSWFAWTVPVANNSPREITSEREGTDNIWTFPQIHLNFPFRGIKHYSWKSLMLTLTPLSQHGTLKPNSLGDEPHPSWVLSSSTAPMKAHHADKSPDRGETIVKSLFRASNKPWALGGFLYRSINTATICQAQTTTVQGCQPGVKLLVYISGVNSVLPNRGTALLLLSFSLGPSWVAAAWSMTRSCNMRWLRPLLPFPFFSLSAGRIQRSLCGFGQADPQHGSSKHR